MQKPLGLFAGLLLFLCHGTDATAASLPPPPAIPSLPGQAMTGGGGCVPSPDISCTGRTARLVVTTNPPGATVSLGYRVIGQTPLDVTVRPGENVNLIVSMDGYRSRMMNILLSNKKTMTLFFPLERIEVYTPYVP